MANDVFDLKTDLYVEFYIPDAGTWIWGASIWDGGDVWADSSSFSWKDLKCESVSVEIDDALNIRDGIFLDPMQSTSRIVITSPDYDPFVSGVIHAGTQVRVRAENLPDSAPSTYVTIFTGQVQSFTSSYNFQGRNIVTLECVDSMQAWLNTLVPSFTIASLTSKPSDVISTLRSTYAPAGTVFIGDANDIYFMAAKTYTNVTVGEIVQDALTCGLGALTSSYAPAWTLTYRAESSVQERRDSSIYKYFDTTHSTSADHICMSQLELSADSRNLPNEVIATINTGTSYTLRNQDAYDLYGAISLQVDVPIDDATGIGLWLDRLDLTAKLRNVETLEFPAIRRDGVLQSWIGEAQLIRDAVEVSYDLGGIAFTDKYLVTRQQQAITPDSWVVSLELWRGI